MSGKTEFTMVRLDDRTFAISYIDDQVLEVLQKLVPLGKEGLFSLAKARNPRFHRLAMSMLKHVYENQDHYHSFDDFLCEIKLRAGWYREHITIKGKVVYVPKSVNFASMKEIEFQEFMTSARDVLMATFCRDWDPEAQNRIITWV